jgi:hypothetical protein
VSREFEHNEDEARRALRIADSIERALRGELRLPEVMAKRAARKARLKAFAIEPEVLINNQWSNRYTVVEVTGSTGPGLLYELTATISKLSLNIASAHVATFGERVVDVFLRDRLDRCRRSPRRRVRRRSSARCCRCLSRRAQGRQGRLKLGCHPGSRAAAIRDPSHTSRMQSMGSRLLAEPVIGPRGARTRWLGRDDSYFLLTMKLAHVAGTQRQRPTRHHARILNRALNRAP